MIRFSWPCNFLTQNSTFYKHSTTFSYEQIQSNWYGLFTSFITQKFIIKFNFCFFSGYQGLADARSTKLGPSKEQQRRQQQWNWLIKCTLTHNSIWWKTSSIRIILGFSFFLPPLLLFRSSSFRRSIRIHVKNEVI